MKFVIMALKGLWSNRIPIDLLEPHSQVYRAAFVLGKLENLHLKLLKTSLENQLYSRNETDFITIKLLSEGLAVFGDFIERAEKSFELVEELFGATDPTLAEYQIDEKFYATSWHEATLEVVEYYRCKIISAFQIQSQDKISSDLFVPLLSDPIRYPLNENHFPDSNLMDYIFASLDKELFRTWKCWYPPGTKYKTLLDTDENTRNQITANMKPRLSDAEEKIVTVIQEANKRLTTKEILAELEKKFGAVSEGTTKVNLATLVRRRILNNRQDGMLKGYGLPEWD
jgi:hypothetical protein